jgi:hypothetical protein
MTGKDGRHSERMGMGGVLLPQPGAHELSGPVGNMYRGVLGQSATVGHRGHWCITSRMNEGEEDRRTHNAGAK